MMFGVNSIYPNPESIEILLQILLKISELDVVAAIGCIHLGWIILIYDLPTHVVLIMLALMGVKENTN